MLELRKEGAIIKKIVFALVLLGIFFQQNGGIFAQNSETGEKPEISRGSIPEELLRPRREEAPRYPVDMVIGPLGQGKASDEAYAFARNVASALVEGRMNAPALSAVKTATVESYLSALEAASPRSFRLGGGKEEADGSFSFLARFIGREQSITGELFVRFEQQRKRPSPPAPDTSVEASDASSDASDEEAAAEPVPPETVAAEAAPPVWVFDELILEEVRSRKDENGEAKHRFDFSPYERFF